MATNHHGPFLLTLLLFPELEKAEDGRVVNVSSSLHKLPSAFNFGDPTYAKGGYTLFGAYAQASVSLLGCGWVGGCRDDPPKKRTLLAAQSIN